MRPEEIARRLLFKMNCVIWFAPLLTIAFLWCLFAGTYSAR